VHAIVTHASRRIGVPLLVVTLVLASGIAFTGCAGGFSVGSHRKLKVSEIEAEGAERLEEQIGVGRGRADLDCPGSSIDVERGVTLACTLTDTKTKDVYDATVELTDSKGKFDVQVAPQPRDPDATI